MSVTVWIVLAFVLGVVFGRISAGGSARAVRPGSPLGPVPPAVAGDPNGPYRVVLLQRGENLIATIKAVRQVTRLGLKDAKDRMEAAPCELMRLNSLDQARAVAFAFQGIAPVRIDGPQGSETVPDFAIAPGSGQNTFR